MKNVGIIDRTLRIIIGTALLALAWVYGGPFILSLVFAVGGVSMLVTAITGYCFIFRALGISTVGKKKDQSCEDE